MNKIFNKIKEVISEPAGFFESLHKEKGIKEAFVYTAILGLFSIALSLVVNHFFSSYSYEWISKMFNIPIKNPEIGIGITIAFTVLGYTFSLIGSFVWAGLLHIWILIFGGKADYTKTYQMAAYANTPGLVFGWIPVLSFFAQIYGLILLIIGTEKVHGISRKKAILMYLIPVAVFIVIMLLFLALGIAVLLKNPGVFTQAMQQAASGQ